MAPPSTSTRSGLSARNLAYLDAHLERYITSGRLCGTVVLVYQGGEVVHRSAQGLMDRERAKPMRPDTIVRLYSMTKPVASVALMQLHERGLVQLDDPVHRYIPSWRNLGVYVSGTHPAFVTAPCERPMTVRDLLSHQSGLTYGFWNRTNVDAAYRVLGIGREGCRDLTEMIERLAGLPLEFSPGTAWNYSVSTDVVGYLVQETSGQRLDVYLREQILDPLGMADTGFWVRPEQVDRFAANYGPAADGGALRLVDDPKDSPYTREPTFFSGGGGLVGTGEDYLRFCRMLLGGGQLDGERLLGRKTVALMLANHLTGGRTLQEAGFARGATINAPGRGFGLGFSVLLDPALSQIAGTPGEGAWGGAASTAFWVDPLEDLAVVFITQFLPALGADEGYNLTRELRGIVYGALE
jgi:CubicO group peptidase (beta-lactamase class C family)